MMVGYGNLHHVDIRDSQKFLESLIESKRFQLSDKDSLVIDCGSGIGRITESLLIRFFQ